MLGFSSTLERKYIGQIILKKSITLPSAENLKKFATGNKRILLLVLGIAIVSSVALTILFRKDTDTSQTDNTQVIIEHENSGPVLEQSGDFSAAAEAYLVDAEAVGEDELEAPLYEQAGDAYVLAENFDRAIESYKKAADANEKIDDKSGTGRANSKTKRAETEKLARQGADE